MEKIKFKTTIWETGGSKAIILPKPIIEYLQLQKEDTIRIQPETSKHGKHITIWKTKKE